MIRKLLILTGGALVLVTGLTGCQNPGQNAVDKIASGIISQTTGGKVNINSATGKVSIKTDQGTFDVNTKNQGGEATTTITDHSTGKSITASSDASGNYSIKDQNGNGTITGSKDSMTIHSNDGTVIKSKSGKDSGWPTDMPTVDNATKFYYSTLNEDNYISGLFKVDSTDLQGTCQKEIDLLTTIGWKTNSNGISVNTSDKIFRNYIKGNESLTVMCSLNDSTINMTLQRTIKSS